MPSSLIRLADKRDAAQIQSIYAPFVLHTPISFEYEPPTVDEMGQRLASTSALFPYLVCEHQGEVVGYVYAGQHSARNAYAWSVNVSVYIHPAWQRCGVGKALYISLFNILVQQGFYNAYAGVTLPNPASVGLHESLGFRPVGVYEAVGYKFGTWHSVGWWQLGLQPRMASPAPPLTMAEVQAQAGWQTALASGLPLLRL